MKDSGAEVGRSILFLFSEPLIGAGGVGRVTESLAEELLGLGYRCEFVSLNPEKTRDYHAIMQRYLPLANPRDRRTRKALRDLIIQERIDVVINQSGLNPPVLSLAKSVSDLVPVLSVHHNCLSGLLDHHQSILKHNLVSRGVPEEVLWNSVLRFLRWRSARRYVKAITLATVGNDHLVMLSKAFVREAQQLAPLAEKAKVHSIANPAPFAAEPKALKTKKQRVLYVGRLENAQKRLDRLLDAWSQIERRLPDWSLDIIGDGPDAEFARVYARNLERVCFIGAADPQEYYRQSNILLLTSDFEGFGMVLVEAQAHGCVPVTTNSFSSITEIVIPDETGIVCENSEPGTISEAVLTLASEPENWKRMAMNGLRHIEAFDPRDIASKWVDLIEAAVENKK